MSSPLQAKILTILITKCCCDVLPENRKCRTTEMKSPFGFYILQSIVTRWNRIVRVPWSVIDRYSNILPLADRERERDPYRVEWQTSAITVAPICLRAIKVQKHCVCHSAQIICNHWMSKRVITWLEFGLAIGHWPSAFPCKLVSLLLSISQHLTHGAERSAHCPPRRIAWTTGHKASTWNTSPDPIHCYACLLHINIE